MGNFEANTPSHFMLDSGVNGRACQKVKRILALPSSQARRELRPLRPNENVLFTPFAAPLHMAVYMQHGTLDDLPFYEAVLSTIKAADPSRAGITESMAANLMTARQMPETRQAVSAVLKRKINPPKEAIGTQIFEKLTGDRDIDSIADIPTSHIPNLTVTLIEKILQTYPNSQIEQSTENNVIIHTKSGELITISTGFFHENSNNPFLHIQKGNAVIHFKPFSFWGVVNPYDVISWDRAEAFLSEKNTSELTKSPLPQIDERTFAELIDAGIYFTNGPVMQGFKQHSGRNMTILFGYEYMNIAGSPMKIAHKNGLTTGKNKYLLLPRTIARMMRKATDHEANLGTTIKGLYALKSIYTNRFATPAINEDDLNFIKKQIGKVEEGGGMSLHVPLLSCYAKQEAEDSVLAIGADLIAATIQNPGRLWRYLIGTEFYKLLPAISHLRSAELEDIDTMLHPLYPQHDRIAKQNFGERPKNILSELKYENLLRIITHPKAAEWKTHDYNTESAEFVDGLTMVSNALQKYIPKARGQSNFDYLTSIFTFGYKL